MRAARTAVLVLLLAAPATGDGEEWERPWPGLLPVPGAETTTDFLATRIVDAGTGRPVPGARLRAFAEDIDGRTLRYARLVGEGRADADGFAWAPVPADPAAYGPHWVCDAPGFAPAYEWPMPKPRTALGPGVAVAARLLDPLGRPLADVTVEWWLGCPHGPAIASTVTGPDGVFAFRDTNPDEGHLWFVGPPGCESDLGTDVADLLEHGSRRRDLVLPAGITVRGRITDPAGDPIAGAVVRSDQETRGPATATGPDGTFALSGVRADSPVRILHPQGRGKDPAVVEGVTAETPLTVRLTPDGILWDDPPEGEVEVDLRDGEGRPAAEQDVRLVRSDGRSWTQTTAREDGRTGAFARFDVPAGEYTVEDASPFVPLAIPRRAVRVPAGGTARVEVRGLPRLPVRVDAGDAVPDVRLGVVLVARGHERADLSRPVFLSPDEAAAVRYGDAWSVPVGPPAGGVRRAALPPRGPRHRIVLPDGRRIEEAFVRHHGAWVDAEVVDGVLLTPASGRVEVQVDEATRIPVDLPDVPGEEPIVLDVPEARGDAAAPVARILFRRADGSAPESVTLRASGMLLRREPDGSVTPRGAASEWTSFDATSGSEVKVPAHVVLEAPGLATIEADVREGGDHTFTWGTCGLRVSVSGPEGKPAEGVVFLSEGLYRTGGGRLSLDGLRPGTHRLIVSPLTRTHRGVERQVVLLREGDVRELEVRFAER